MSDLKLSDGDRLEIRVARLLTWEGAFVRRRVDLTSYFNPERMQITDLDLIAYSFTTDLALTRTVAECKSGTSKGGPREVDQMLRLVGLRQIVGAGRAIVATRRSASERVRAVGRELRVVVLDSSDLERREARLGIDTDSLWGSHAAELAVEEAQLTKHAKRQKDLERAFWFLKSELWFLEPILAIKRLMTVIGALSKRWVEGISSEDRRCLAWLLTDAVAAFSLAAVRTAADALVLPPDTFRRQTTERLSEGLASYSQLQRLSQAVDRFVVSVLEDAGVPKPKVVGALGAFAPQPPRYAESLLEVLERLAEESRHARFVPQVLDVAMAERIRQGRTREDDLRRMQVDDPQRTLSMARVITKFLGSHASLPADFGEVVGSLDPKPRVQTESEDEAVPLFGDDAGPPIDSKKGQAVSGRVTQTDPK